MPKIYKYIDIYPPNVCINNLKEVLNHYAKQKIIDEIYVIN